MLASRFEKEIFGIGGLVGSGRSELVHLLFGAMQDSGEIWLRGKNLLSVLLKKQLEMV